VRGRPCAARRVGVWIAPLQPWFEKGELDKTVLAEGLDGRFDPIDVIGNTLYITTSFGSPKGSVQAIDLADPARARWKTILAERNDMVLEGVSLAKDCFVTSWSKDVCSRFEVMDLTGKVLHEIALPGLGTASISTDHRRHEAFVTYTSYDAPRTIYQTHVMHPKLAPWARTEIPGDLSGYTVEQKRAKSKDGTEVPMFIVRRKDMKFDGDNPTLLYGYGGFNVSLTPTFNPTIVPWLDAGGVYVVANLRGGGEYGEAWHRAGMQASKQNVFDDFYACAEWLIANKYTKSSRLAACAARAPHWSSRLRASMSLTAPRFPARKVRPQTWTHWLTSAAKPFVAMRAPRRRRRRPRRCARRRRLPRAR
jgi:prolyl oligopeptidase